MQFLEEVARIMALKKRPLTNAKQTAACLLELNFDFVSKIKIYVQEHVKCLTTQKKIVSNVMSFFRLLLELHAKYISSYSKQWKKHHEVWHQLFKLIRDDVQNSAIELHKLVTWILDWSNWFRRYLWFLETAPLDQLYIPHYFSEWFEPVAITDIHLNQAQQLILQIPNRKFNDKFPNMRLPKLPPSDAQYPDCDLCGDKTIMRYKCETCTNGSVICYSCFRQQLWAAHHDEHRVLSEPRELSCSFCRTPIDLNTAMKNVEYIQPTAKRSSADELLSDSKRQRLSEGSEHDDVQATFLD